MRSRSDWEQTLDLIYDAAIQPSLWTEVLTRLNTALGAEASVLTRLNIRTGAGSATLSDHDDAVMRRYFEHYYRINPLQIVQDPRSYVRGWKPRILIDEDWIARDEFERSEYYNDFLKPLSADWSLMVRLGLRGDEVAAISLGRPLRKGRFEAAEVALAARAQRHLIRAYGIGEKFAALEGLNASLTDALEAASVATMLLDGESRLLHLNAAAESILARAHVLKAVNGRLSATDHRASRSLTAIVARAAASDWDVRSAGALSLQTPHGGPPLTLTASPIRLERASVFSRGSAVLVSVTDSSRAAPGGAGFTERFGLTAAEDRLARSLHEGLNLRQAALRHGISINTARVQLASLFAKTGTHRQVELIRLMMSDASMPPAC